ncbi:hypothetical protein [Paenibacillus sp. 1A_MP2]|uniref:hypothetical protein n=1 Tax=Paenibacillus sp. 1A_MP2 TaxID=3457495 RepID=UPI003FCC6215
MEQFREHLKKLELSEDSINVYMRIIIRFYSDTDNSIDSLDNFISSFEQWLSDHAPKNASVHKAAAQAFCRFKFGTKIKFQNSKKYHWSESKLHGLRKGSIRNSFLS